MQVEMQRHRAEQYGRLAAVLEKDHEVPGAAAIFDQALSCGLAAIVAHEWPGEELKKNADVKSARFLLDVVKTKAEECPDRAGVRILRGSDGSLDVRIECKTLVEAIDHTAAIRHARGVGELKRPHVDALLELDAHDALLQVLDEQRESDWVKEEIRQRHDRMRASDYLELIGEEEAERRAKAAEDFVVISPGDVDDGAALDTCPVCGWEALAVSGIDPFGAGVGSGACFVCSYVRSVVEAEDLARGAMMARHMDG
ncbi:hypothetical protein QFW82_29785 [Streptomyces malaysiensis subsp. malaysiensis]|uniref:hypothetical protein n=1 Tax=Streptomyces malaysiensis TaxID=92644 RepID=UPI0024C0BA2F|nr:hypothetical protein [Streptomyces sp. NA07423]WHX20932.1 hypothetical protein QFW82_29785 [Streptomyces sp. NA07423]